MRLKRTEKEVDDRKWEVFQEWAPEIPRIFTKTIKPLEIITLGEFFELVMNAALKAACDDLDTDYDLVPVFRLTAGITHSWLITDVNIDYPYIVHGFCDLGSGLCHEGCVDLIGLLEGQLNKTLFPIQKDEAFKSEFPLSYYVKQVVQAQQKSSNLINSTIHSVKNNRSDQSVVSH